MPALNPRRDSIDHSFVADVVAAVRRASLGELVAPGGRTVGNGRRARRVAAATTESQAPRAARSSGRLRPRSAEKISTAVGRVVELLHKHKYGLLAEQTRAKVGLQAKDMPRLLKAELAAPKVLMSNGQARDHVLREVAQE
jgi:hypothetical protein